MPPKPDLRQAINSVNARQAEPVREAPPPRLPVSKAENPHYRPSREGKANITGYFDRTVKKQLRMIAADLDTTIEDCLAEALNDFFAKHGKPEIASRKDRA
jgi:hypothetical protein